MTIRSPATPLSKGVRLGNAGAPQVPVSGFTLIELVVVITLIGLMLGAAIPLFQSTLQKQRADSVSDEVAMTLRLANQKSVFQQKKHEFVVDFDHGRYWLEYLQQRKHSKKMKMMPDEIRSLRGDFVFILAYFPDQDHSEHRRKTRITFFPDGTSQEAVLLLGKPGSTNGEYSSVFGIEIRGSDGRVRILPEEEWRQYEHLL